MKENNNASSLDKNLKTKGYIVPIIFAVVVALLMVIFSSPVFGFFPSGNHDDSLTTTSPTQTTEYVADEYVQS